MSPIYKSFTQTHEHTKDFPYIGNKRFTYTCDNVASPCYIVLDYSLNSIEIAMIAKTLITMKTPMYGNASISATITKPMKSCSIEPPCSFALIVYEYKKVDSKKRGM